LLDEIFGRINKIFSGSPAILSAAAFPFLSAQIIFTSSEKIFF